MIAAAALPAAFAVAACGSAASPRTRSSASVRATVPAPSTAKAVGQLLIATYKGTTPPRSILVAVRAGRIGSIILMGDNTGDSVGVTQRATRALQKAARSGGNPGLLIMTDQEGGEVKRLPGPPAYSASQMANPSLAGAQGHATALMLRKAGVNVDLAPVSDVTRVDGFMSKEQRTFGSNPAAVGRAACAFASGLASGGVAYTLKHFPGLGDAVQSTDVAPVAISESAAEIEDDDAAYRSCGSGPKALVMVSSASYTNLTGTLPAVMTPAIYGKVMARDGITAVTVSDALDTPAIKPWPSAARRSIAAGLDLAMYPNREADALSSYSTLLGDVRGGQLSARRVRAAAMRVLALKRSLGLT